MKTLPVLTFVLFFTFLLTGFLVGSMVGHMGFAENRALSLVFPLADRSANPAMDETAQAVLETVQQYRPETDQPVQSELEAAPAESQVQAVPEVPQPAPEQLPLPEPQKSQELLTPGGNGQHNLLVIGVDSLEAPQPRLESLWLVAYIHPTPHFTLLPVYPRASALMPSKGEDRPKNLGHLAGLFRLDEDGAPHPDFLNEIDLWWDHYIILDRTSLAIVIDFIGGLSVGDVYRSGPPLVAALPAVERDPQAALKAQVNLLRSMCAQSAKMSEKQQLASLFRLVPGHIRTDMVLEQALTAWENLKSGGSFACEFPTLPQPAP